MPPRKTPSRASQSVGPSETPQRITRARSKTPLPALAAGASHAYGAPGKAELTSQLRATTADFSEVFEESRTTIGAMPPPQNAGVGTGESIQGGEGGEGGDRAPSPVQQPRRRHYSGRPPVIPEEGPEMGFRRTPPPIRTDVELTGRPATALDHGAQYAGVFATLRAGMRRQLANPNSMLWTFALLSLVLSIGFSLGLFSLFVPLPSSIDAARENFTLGMRVAFRQSPYDRPPDFLERNWHQFKHDMLFSEQLVNYNIPEIQYAINVNFLHRLETLEKRVGAVEEALALDRDTLSEMQRMLPSHVLVQIVDGKPEIPADFWGALEHRLVESTDLAPRWQAWLLQNEAQMRDLTEQYIGAALDRELENKRIIQRGDFIKVLDERNNYLVSQYREEVRAFWEKESENVKQYAGVAARDALENMPDYNLIKGQLAALVRFNHVKNTYDLLQQMNYFAIGMGARINPHLSSPTKTTGVRDGIAGIYDVINPLTTQPNGHITALQKWDEATECWCGTTGKDTHVQLGVMTSRFYPRALIIEHAPASATRDIKAAPRDLAVWMGFDSPAQAKAARKAMATLPEYKPDDCGPSPGNQWVCILTAYYDIHHGNHVQSSRVWADFQEMNMSTGSVIVRALTNWGSNYTCFYRVRFTGEQAEEPVVKKGFLDWVFGD